MKHNDISIRQTFYWLYAQSHHGSTIFDDLHIAPGTRHTIDTLGGCRTWNFQITTQHKLTTLLRSKNIMQKPVCTTLSRRETHEKWQENKPYQCIDRQHKDNQ